MVYFEEQKLDSQLIISVFSYNIYWGLASIAQHVGYNDLMILYDIVHHSHLSHMHVMRLYISAN